jgi:N-acetylmuramoyl-L-alanine amidase/Putative peptidoglycan binding domain
MRTAELQSRLRALGFDPGPSDGIYGELTEDAIFDCLDKYTPAVELTAGLVPYEWMPACDMERIVCHWTAGAHKASEHDRDYYHILIEDDGRLVRGKYSIKENVSTADGVYAAHCKNCNTGSIGVSLCCMAGAIESPFDAGQYPMTGKQWDTLAEVVAELCRAYSIPIARETVLSHAEVQPTLGIEQSGKWDFTRLAFDPAIQGAIACGDRLREAVTIILS